MSEQTKNPPQKPIIIRAATPTDAGGIRALHISVATRSGGIARYADEVTEEYVNDFVRQSLKSGIIVVAENTDTSAIVGELHTYGCGLRRLAHVLSSLTVAVHPDTQGQGIGRKLFEEMLRTVREHRPEILRVELIVQESHLRARRLYESVGFREEGRLINGILSTKTGLPENDVPMAWLRN